DLVIDFMFDPSPSLQRFRHGQSRLNYGPPAAEIYYISKRYLISGGGFFSSSDRLRGEDAVALPTTLMPAALGGDCGECVRMDGYPPERRSNMGVAPGFACGVNPKIPESLSKPPIAKTIDDHWTFLDCTSPAGFPAGAGFYVAVYRANESGTDFGFFAVTDE